MLTEELDNLHSQFLLDPEIIYLNHGSFGACPKPIFEDYQKWQLELEREPAQFIQVNGPKYLENSRKALAQFIGCNANDVVFTTNPTYAINIIAKGLDLKPGDEILTTNLEYGAMDRTWEYYCQKSGATYIKQHISLPLKSKEQFLNEFFMGLGPKTKAIFISHITSSTALILPVHEICEYAKSKGIFTIVDGAHVPAHIPLNLEILKADVYTGACHKWMLTPKGSSFLFLKSEFQERFDPLIISWGFKSDFPSHSKFLDYHQFNGTRDYSAFLTIPKAIEFLKENDWPRISEASRKLVIDNYEKVCSVLGTSPICPVNNEFLGQMCSTPINTSSPEKIQRYLFERYKIEIPVMRHGKDNYIRFSTQVYVNQRQIDQLFDALKEMIKGKIIGN